MTSGQNIPGWHRSRTSGATGKGWIHDGEMNPGESMPRSHCSQDDVEFPPTAFAKTLPDRTGIGMQFLRAGVAPCLLLDDRTLVVFACLADPDRPFSVT